MDIHNYFKLLNLETVDADIYTSLCQIGNQPASTVARRLNLERTRVYRHLQKMAQLGIINTSQSRWVTTFYVDDIRGLNQLIWQRLHEASKIDTWREKALEHIQKISRTDLRVPKVRLYDRSEEIHLVFSDMLEELRNQKLLTLRMFASNTFDEQQSTSMIGVSLEDFFSQLQDRHVSVESYLGNWGLIMERIERTTKLKELLGLPTAPSSIHIFIVGYIVYIVIYRDDPVGIKIENELFADVLHLLLDQIGND